MQAQQKITDIPASTGETIEITERHILNRHIIFKQEITQLCLKYQYSQSFLTKELCSFLIRNVLLTEFVDIGTLIELVQNKIGKLNIPTSEKECLIIYGDLQAILEKPQYNIYEIISEYYKIIIKFLTEAELANKQSLPNLQQQPEMEMKIKTMILSTSNTTQFDKFDKIEDEFKVENINAWFKLEIQKFCYKYQDNKDILITSLLLFFNRNLLSSCRYENIGQLLQATREMIRELNNAKNISKDFRAAIKILEAILEKPQYNPYNIVAEYKKRVNIHLLEKIKQELDTKSNALEATKQQLLSQQQTSAKTKSALESLEQKFKVEEEKNKQMEGKLAEQLKKTASAEEQLMQMIKEHEMLKFTPNESVSSKKQTSDKKSTQRHSMLFAPACSESHDKSAALSIALEELNRYWSKERVILLKTLSEILQTWPQGYAEDEAFIRSQLNEFFDKEIPVAKILTQLKQRTFVSQDIDQKIKRIDISEESKNKLPWPRDSNGHIDITKIKEYSTHIMSLDPNSGDRHRLYLVNSTKKAERQCKIAILLGLDSQKIYQEKVEQLNAILQEVKNRLEVAQLQSR